jgi:hypothetical protein
MACFIEFPQTVRMDFGFKDFAAGALSLMSDCAFKSEYSFRSEYQMKPEYG